MMKKVLASGLVLVILLAVQSCGPGTIEKTSAFRTTNKYNPSGDSVILRFTLTLTYESGFFDIIDLPVPEYNKTSEYKNVVTARQEDSFFGPGDTQVPTKIEFTVDRLYGGSKEIIYSLKDSIGPSGIVSPDLWTSGSKFRITYDGDSAIAVRE